MDVEGGGLFGYGWGRAPWMWMGEDSVDVDGGGLCGWGLGRAPWIWMGEGSEDGGPLADGDPGASQMGSGDLPPRRQGSGGRVCEVWDSGVGVQDPRDRPSPELCNQTVMLHSP